MISLTNVTHRYGRHVALRNLTLDLPAGVSGLLGPNGAGKTTLLRALATLHQPQDGEIRILGLNPARAPERLALRRVLGYLPQDFTPYPTFTAFEFVEYIAILKGMKRPAERRTRVLEVLAGVGLEGVAHRRAGGFSGGMRRRLGIAQAIVNRPELLIVDEPTAGLDPAERVRFRHLLASTEARVAVISTHIVEDVTAVAPQVSVLLGGELKYQGSPQGLTDYAQGRVYVGSDLSGTVVQLTDVGPRVLTADPLPGLIACAPTVEEGYLALAGRGA
ncbi:ABC transporter ATP-binding protein [Deinococcus koreensis]|uniref:ABC transporter ATP-binding protein n=1 Tax=Deinococcus koreensis TaxID=2054903 RepID=A0A2K3UZH6_9DEIO|nr:ABC transporter ATP-binding protein [Deinococcus koreensis]PNY81931.1 ABC transporter ATP-binding protein [Deinococcus koreensis]